MLDEHSYETLRITHHPSTDGETVEWRLYSGRVLVTSVFLTGKSRVTATKYLLRKAIRD